jgi:hypothetical protein
MWTAAVIVSTTAVIGIARPKLAAASATSLPGDQAYPFDG